MTDESKSGIQRDMKETFLEIELTLWTVGSSKAEIHGAKVTFHSLEDLSAHYSKNDGFGAVTTNSELSNQYGFEVLTRENKTNKTQDRFGYVCHHCVSYVAREPKIFAEEVKTITSAKDLAYICQLCGSDLQAKRTDMNRHI